MLVVDLTLLLQSLILGLCALIIQPVVLEVLQYLCTVLKKWLDLCEGLLHLEVKHKGLLDSNFCKHFF